jgi:virginiamycin A acetyltransferase
MKHLLRNWLWKALGYRYYEFLRHQKHVYLKDARNCVIGRGSYDNGAVVWRWSPNAKLVIGAYSSLAHGVQLFLDGGFHDMDCVTTFPLFSELYKSESWDYRINGRTSKAEYFQKLTRKHSIFIGNDVWIGTDAMIMPGVIIGDGAVIMPGSVVTGTIKPYEIFGGAPARKIRQRFDDETIRQLLAIEWWNWDEATIRERIEDFYFNTASFLKKYGVTCMSVI